MTRSALAEPTQALTISADDAGLARASQWASEAGGRLRLSSSLLFSINVCLEEVISNTIRYGLADAAATEKCIEIALSLDAGSLRLEIQDHGAAFDPREAPKPTFHSDLNDAEIGGLGLHLVKSLTQSIAYERVANTNRLLLVFSLPG